MKDCSSYYFVEADTDEHKNIVQPHFSCRATCYVLAIILLRCGISLPACEFIRIYYFKHLIIGIHYLTQNLLCFLVQFNLLKAQGPAGS